MMEKTVLYRDCGEGGAAPAAVATAEDGASVPEASAEGQSATPAEPTRTHKGKKAKAGDRKPKGSKGARKGRGKGARKVASKGARKGAVKNKTAKATSKEAGRSKSDVTESLRSITKARQFKKIFHTLEEHVKEAWNAATSMMGLTGNPRKDQTAIINSYLE